MRFVHRVSEFKGFLSRSTKSNCVLVSVISNRVIVGVISNCVIMNVILNRVIVGVISSFPNEWLVLRRE